MQIGNPIRKIDMYSVFKLAFFMYIILLYNYILLYKLHVPFPTTVVKCKLHTSFNAF